MGKTANKNFIRHLFTQIRRTPVNYLYYQDLFDYLRTIEVEDWEMAHEKNRELREKISGNPDLTFACCLILLILTVVFGAYGKGYNPYYIRSINHYLSNYCISNTQGNGCDDRYNTCKCVRVCLFSVLCWAVMTLVAQNLTVSSMTAASMDISASQYERKDGKKINTRAAR